MRMVEGIDDKYKAKLNLLSSCCEKLQKENETLAHKILQSKRNLRKARKLRMRLLQKLDDVGDPWRLELEQIKDTSLPLNSKISSQSSPVFNEEIKIKSPTHNSNLSKPNSHGISKASKAKPAAINVSSKGEPKSNKAVNDSKNKMKNVYHDSNKAMNGNFTS